MSSKSKENKREKKKRNWKKENKGKWLLFLHLGDKFILVLTQLFTTWNCVCLKRFNQSKKEKKHSITKEFSYIDAILYWWMKQIANGKMTIKFKTFAFTFIHTKKCKMFHILLWRKKKNATKIRSCKPHKLSYKCIWFLPAECLFFSSFFLSFVVVVVFFSRCIWNGI